MLLNLFSLRNPLIIYIVFRHRNVLACDLPAGVAVEDNLLGLDLESALGEQVGHAFFSAHRVAEVAGEELDVFFVAIEF